jgi:pimeloyl-ACP methyl ester carboxylesterase
MALLIILASTSFLVAVQALPQHKTQPSITWKPCPDVNQQITASNGIAGATFDCAHLEVPLDYTNSSSVPLELSLFKVNATQEPKLGSVLINFGGPGGTGAQNLPVLAAEMAANIGPQWDLVSWDPRGTGKTIPFDCGVNLAELSGSMAKSQHKRGEPELASGNLTDYFLRFGWDLVGAQADACHDTMRETGQYIGTAFTARDMIKIVDALDEDGFLRYYGWSYGTVLGAYAAAMFPERIDRMVLDGNIDPEDYQAGHYGDFIRDADKAFAGFLQECFDNKANCALAQYTNATSVDDLFDPVNEFLQSLNTTDYYGESFASAFLLSSSIFSKLYYPGTWPALGDLIVSYLNGTASLNTSGSSPPNTTAEPYDLGASWSVYGIRAGDALWRIDTAEEYLPRVEYQQNISSFSSSYQAIWPSARWSINAKERFTGSFQGVKTRHEILFVNGEYDPVTPLAHAYRSSAGFEGSVVLPHSGYGHGIVVSPSACVAGHVQAYFKEGVLPESGSHCEPDSGPFDAPPAAEMLSSSKI